ncbi:MAG TPA: lipase family protein [Burkholderiales bacterium]
MPTSSDFPFVPRTTKYQPENAYSLGQAANLAYAGAPDVQRTTAKWGFQKFKFFDRADTQAYAIGNDETIVVAFRGTEPKDLHDWLTDAEFDLVDGPFGKVHDGFYRALHQVWRDVYATILEFQDKAQSLWFAGHSLGAALAALAVATLRAEHDKPVYGLYTFGQPRTGDRDFEKGFDQDFESQCFRFVNNNDIVTRVPLRVMGYSHVGTFLYFDDKGKIQEDPSWWYRFLDGVKGDLENLGKMLPDQLADHSMDRYVALLQKNIKNNPF